ncbi:MAG TPA: ADP-forming succinate--CoA ligase subunit beta [Rhodospirillaceae bacterium]|nr:MAG: succinate--CoA ligase subunit beta [Alphaproteobacteria bacterium GWF2_58_20]HAU29910.1 ADP-forming succinate--CoA ligase subunit beta [Rhodospirillaceae bacterium]
MRIHEYQAKSILRSYGVPTPRGGVAFTPDEAVSVAERLGGSFWVIKAQIHAGDRARGGGVITAHSLDEVRKAAEGMIGMRLITPQTPTEGNTVMRVYVEEGVEISRELYFALLVDPLTLGASLIAAPERGVTLEEIATRAPDRILRAAIDPAVGLMPFQVRRICYSLGLDTQQMRKAVDIIGAVYKAYVDLDALNIEINPMVVTGRGELMVLDARMRFDDNALFRQKGIAALRDRSEENTFERQASDAGLTYIRLTGNVGCLANGAGLAMATVDAIRNAGGNPANFLDIGRAPSRERMAEALRILEADPNVDCVCAILQGGLARTETVAENLTSIIRERLYTLPIVVRLAGENQNAGEAILHDYGPAIHVAGTIGEAASLAANIAREHA